LTMGQLLNSNCCGHRNAYSSKIVKQRWIKNVSISHASTRQEVTPQKVSSTQQATSPAKVGFQPAQSMEIKLMHWNILADKLAYGSFPLVEERYLKWEFRFSLILQQIKQMDPDCIGLSEVDVMPHYKRIAEAMSSLGYQDYFVEKSNGVSGSAIFFKRDKFICLEQNFIRFAPDSSQFFIYCRLAKRETLLSQLGFKSPISGIDSLKGTLGKSASTNRNVVIDPKLQFVFGETHLKAKPKYMEQRVSQTQKIVAYFKEQF